MNFGGTIVNTKGANLPKNPFNLGVAGQPKTSEHLETAIDHLKQGFTHKSLNHTRLMPCRFALIEQPCRMQHHLSTGVQVDGIARQHLRKSAVFNQTIAKSCPSFRVVDGDVLRPNG